jgi:polyhydroxyalkanoate synthesis regulator phasin
MIKSFRCVIDLELQDGSKHQFAASSGAVTKMIELAAAVSKKVQEAVDRLSGEFTADATKQLVDEQRAHASTKDAHEKLGAAHRELQKLIDDTTKPAGVSASAAPQEQSQLLTPTKYQHKRNR